MDIWSAFAAVTPFEHLGFAKPAGPICFKNSRCAYLLEDTRGSCGPRSFPLELSRCSSLKLEDMIDIVNMMFLDSPESGEGSSTRPLDKLLPRCGFYVGCKFVPNMSNSRISSSYPPAMLMKN